MTTHPTSRPFTKAFPKARHPSQAPSESLPHASGRSTSASSTFSRIFSLNKTRHKSGNLDTVQLSDTITDEEELILVDDHGPKPGQVEPNKRRLACYNGEFGPVVDIQRQTPMSKRSPGRNDHTRRAIRHSLPSQRRSPRRAISRTLLRSPSHPGLVDRSIRAASPSRPSTPTPAPSRSMRNQLSRGQIAALYKTNAPPAPPVPPKSPRHCADSSMAAVRTITLIKQARSVPSLHSVNLDDIFRDGMRSSRATASPPSRPDRVDRFTSNASYGTILEPMHAINVIEAKPAPSQTSASTRTSTPSPARMKRRLPSIPPSPRPTVVTTPVSSKESNPASSTTGRKIRRKAVPSPLSDVSIPREGLWDDTRNDPSPTALTLINVLPPTTICDVEDSGRHRQRRTSDPIASQVTISPLKLPKLSQCPRLSVSTTDFGPAQALDQAKNESIRRFSRLDFESQLDELFGVLGRTGTQESQQTLNFNLVEKDLHRSATLLPLRCVQQGWTVMEPSVDVLVESQAASVDGNASASKATSRAASNVSLHDHSATVPQRTAQTAPSVELLHSHRFIPSGRSFEPIRTQQPTPDPRAAVSAQSKDLSKAIPRPANGRVRSAIERIENKPKVASRPVGPAASPVSITSPITPVRVLGRILEQRSLVSSADLTLTSKRIMEETRAKRLGR